MYYSGDTMGRALARRTERFDSWAIKKYSSSQKCEAAEGLLCRPILADACCLECFKKNLDNT